MRISLFITALFFLNSCKKEKSANESSAPIPTGPELRDSIVGDYTVAKIYHHVIYTDSSSYFGADTSLMTITVNKNGTWGNEISMTNPMSGLNVNMPEAIVDTAGVLTMTNSYLPPSFSCTLNGITFVAYVWIGGPTGEFINWYGNKN